MVDDALSFGKLRLRRHCRDRARRRQFAAEIVIYEKTLMNIANRNKGTNLLIPEHGSMTQLGVIHQNFN